MIMLKAKWDPEKTRAEWKGPYGKGTIHIAHPPEIAGYQIHVKENGSVIKSSIPYASKQEALRDAERVAEALWGFLRGKE